MTRKVDKLTSSPSMADTAMATTDAHVYSYLQHQKLIDGGCGDVWGGGWGYMLGFRVYERGLYSNNFMGNAMVDLG